MSVILPLVLICMRSNQSEILFQAIAYWFVMLMIWMNKKSFIKMKMGKRKSIR